MNTSPTDLSKHRDKKMADLIAKTAEEIAVAFEHADNLVVFQRTDDTLSVADWRKAARAAGKILDGRKVKTHAFTDDDGAPRVLAHIVLTPIEQEAEHEYYGKQIGTMEPGKRIPAPPFRKLRRGSSTS